MNIQSAQYVNDQNGDQVSIQVTYEDDAGDEQQTNAPIGGATWVNAELNTWVAKGGKIQAAD